MLNSKTLTSIQLTKPKLDKPLILLLGLSLLVTFLALSGKLWDRYQVAEDMQNFHWMARYQDPTLLTPDYLAPGNNLIEINFLDRTFIFSTLSLGYGLFFYLASFIIDPIWLSKLLVFGLMPLCVLYLFEFGKWAGGRLAGFGVGILFVFFMTASNDSISIASGLQRGLAIPLMILFLCFVALEKYWLAASILFISTLFYLPIFPLTFLIYGLSFITMARPLKISLHLTRAQLAPFIITSICSTLVVLIALASQRGMLPVQDSSLSFEPATHTGLPIAQNPFFQADGAVPLFLGTILLGEAGIFNSGADAVNSIVLLLLSIWIYLAQGRPALRRIPAWCWRLLIAGFILYGAASVAVFGFSSHAIYWPSRYTRVSLFLFGVYFVGLNWPYEWRKMPPLFRRPENLRRLIVVVISIVVSLLAIYALPNTRLLVLSVLLLFGLIFSGLLAVFVGHEIFMGLRNWSAANINIGGTMKLLAGALIMVLAGIFYIKSLGFRTIEPSAAQQDVYEFVGDLPKDVILAGEPDIMSGIPLFSKRRILFKGLLPDGNAPILDYFAAYYAESPQPILDFCQRYKITHLVLTTEDFTPKYLAKEEFFYQPWNDYIVETVRGRTEFALPKLQPIFTSGPYRVIKCEVQTLLSSSQN